MADPLSTAASVIAVAQLAEKLIFLGCTYIGGAKAASKDLRDLVDELQSLGKVLIVLQDYAQADKNLQSTALQSLNGQNGPLQGCALELRRLQLKLEPKQGLKGMVQSLKWPLKEPETLQCISRIQRQKNLFILALTVDHISLCKAIEAYVKGIDHTTEEIKASMQDTNITIRDLKARFEAEFSAQSSWRQKHESLQIVEAREKVLKWICPDTIEKKHLEVSNKRQKNTGNWLLEAPQFQELLNGGNSRLLWGYGIRKLYRKRTVLIAIGKKADLFNSWGWENLFKIFADKCSSAVIDYLQDQTSTKHYGVAYVYFDYKEQENQMPINILASIVKQLASQLPGPHLPKEIEELHQRLRYQGKRPTFEELYAILHILLQYPLFSQNRVFLIFDALDECHPENQRKDLLPLFHRLAKDGASLFLTSRHYPEDIQQSFRDSEKIELVAKEKDIETYIQEKISENPRAKRLVEQSNCKNRIVSELTNCAKGMFLLVKFHVEYICQQTTPNQVLDALESLRLQKSSIKKRPLDPTYDRVMRSINEQSEACAELAIKVLSWLVNARRTLTVKEIQTAISVDLDRCELDELDLPDKETLLEVCASFVIIDEHSDTIKLAHYTVQDYLLRKSIIPKDAGLKIALACTTFLSFEAFKTGACTSNESLETRLRTYHFLDYAAHNLSPHLNDCSEQESASIETILRFLASQGNISSYLQIVHAWGYGKGDSEHFNRYPKDHLPLHLASSLGHCAVIRALLEGADFSIPNNNGWENVYRAAFKGHDAVVRLLLEKRADISASESNGLTALHMAVAHGHKAAVQLLLEKGSDATLPCNNGETALHIAASQGRHEVIQVLLSHGGKACISRRDINGRTALYTAASNGHSAVTKLLLENDADASVIENSGETALHIAVSKRHEAVVRLLIEGGVKISARDYFGRTALYIAVYNLDEAMVKSLLDGGADVCTKTNSQETALSVAASRRNMTITRLLLEKGTDISATIISAKITSDGWTLLHLAASNGNQAVVQLLLDKGADISTVKNDGWTALHLAASGGHQAVVQLLLDKGADIAAVTNDGGRTALHLAVYNGHQAVVQLLLDKGADMSAVTGDYRGWTVLHLAACVGHQEVVQLLLDKGADISAVKNGGWAVLHLAAYNGHQAVVQLLLDKGADISAVKNDGWTVLHLAACVGHQTVVQLLLDKGADISAVTNGDGWTALHLAAFNGHQVVVQLLLDKGADISAKTNYGSTLLQLATVNGHRAMVKLLLDKGTDISTVTDGNGESTDDGGESTELHLAAFKGHQEIVPLLVDRSADTSAVKDDQQHYT